MGLQQNSPCVCYLLRVSLRTCTRCAGKGQMMLEKADDVLCVLGLN